MPPSEESLEAAYPGARLGLPARGPGAVAGWGRRFLALALDWVASMLVAGLFIGTAVWSGRGAEQWLTMLVFLVEASVLTPLVGGSFGQVATRVVVTRLDGRRVGLLPAVVRTFLICLVVPPLVFNRDGRGLHDLAVGTITLRR